MQRSDKPWAAAAAAARANETYVRVSPRKNPRNHQSDHPPTWVAHRQSLEKFKFRNLLLVPGTP